MKKRNLVLMMALAASMSLGACSGGGDAEKSAGLGQETVNQENGSGESAGEETAEEEEKVGEAGETAKADWTIEEAIENQKRFSGKGFYTMYAEGTALYAAPNAVNDTRSFSRYAGLVSEGTAGSQIRQIQTEDYGDTELILDAEGRLWYGGKQIFDNCNIQYFDCFLSRVPDTPRTWPQ